MSSRFVSAGTTDNPIERDGEWLKAEQEIEAKRRRKEEESKHEGGKTLYEVLQSNKAAKQEAFEESIKLKNQFRNLDEDEIEFLDSVLESTRAKEEAVKKETTEQLDIFRRQQEEADKALLEQRGDKEDGEGKAGSLTAGESQWAVNARKRKRTKEKEGLKGIKLRKSSSTNEAPVGLPDARRDRATGESSSTGSPGERLTNLPPKPPVKGKSKAETLASPPVTSATVAASPKHEKNVNSNPVALGLAGYSSAEEE